MSDEDDSVDFGAEAAEADLSAARQRIAELERERDQLAEIVAIKRARAPVWDRLDALAHQVETLSSHPGSGVQLAIAREALERIGNAPDDRCYEAGGIARAALARLASPLGSGVPALDPVTVEACAKDIDREARHAQDIGDTALAMSLAGLAYRIRSLTSQPGIGK